MVFCVDMFGGAEVSFTITTCFAPTTLHLTTSIFRFAFERLHMNADALDSFQQALEIAKYKGGLSAKGNLLKRMGRESESLKTYEELVAFDPGYKQVCVRVCF